jgi:hypothetical protein
MWRSQRELGRGRYSKLSVALPYPVRTAPLPVDNFKNKASTLHWQSAQATGSTCRLPAGRQALRPVTLEIWRVTVWGVSGPMATVSAWETVTRRRCRKGVVLTGTKAFLWSQPPVQCWETILQPSQPPSCLNIENTLTSNHFWLKPPSNKFGSRCINFDGET